MSVYIHTGGAVADGPAVIFVHGAGMDHTVWRFQTRWLAHHGRRVLAPDLPGHGASEGEPFTSIAEGAAWLGAFLDEHGGSGAVLVGHSMGALLAVEAADRTDLTHLVLVAAGMRMPVHPVLLAAAADDLPRAAAFIGGWSMPPGHRGDHPEPGTWQQGATIRLLERSAPGVLAADLRSCAAYDAASRAARLAVPATVVSGTADRMVPHRAARELAEAIPRARLVPMVGAGHEPMIQMPRRFNRILEAILDGDGKG